MLISATSALVLNWTSKDIWETENAQDYFESLNLSEGNSLLNRFSELEKYMHTQSVTNRKYFVRKTIIEFLEGKEEGQVIILAAGIAPLSVEIATLFPGSVLFDVDKYSMPDKKNHLKNICHNIKFIEADITDIDFLKTVLIKNGWNPGKHSILVMEGITYYLLENDLKNIFRFFADNNASLVADFELKPEYINEKNRRFGVDVFRKISESVGLDFVNFYEPYYFMKLVQECGFENPEKFNMREIQIERAGKKDPFDFEDSGWIALVKN
jgi:O-methyltransferase involved in polyketide biosynthesis